MPVTKITEQDLKFLKEHAQDPVWKVEDISKVFNLINDPKNATEIIKALSGADIINLAKWVHAPIYDTWSTQQKIALVKKDISFFGEFPDLTHGGMMDDQELLRVCLSEFNKKFSPLERKDEYYFHFKTTFRHITFNQENLELFIKSFPDHSPFIFEEFPFNDISNWRELIKSNPNLALENRMLQAMEEVNYFSKSSLQEFKAKYDDLLKNKTFFNHFIKSANSEIKNKIDQEELESEEDIFFEESNNRFSAAAEIEEESNRKIERYISSLDFIASTFGPYKDFIMQQELAKAKKTTAGVSG